MAIPLLTWRPIRGPVHIFGQMFPPKDWTTSTLGSRGSTFAQERRRHCNCPNHAHGFSAKGTSPLALPSTLRCSRRPSSSEEPKRTERHCRPSVSGALPPFVVLLLGVRQGFSTESTRKALPLNRENIAWNAKSRRGAAVKSRISARTLLQH